MSMIAAMKTTQDKSRVLQIRQRARELAHDLEHGYLELAKLLYEVYDKSEDGDPTKPPLYISWGYTSFADYVDNDLQFSLRKAQRLRFIWYTLTVKLANLDQKVKARLVALGWSKLRELVRVLTLDNAAEWLTKAENMSFIHLENSIRSSREHEKLTVMQEEVAKAKARAKAREQENGFDLEAEVDDEEEVDLDLDPPAKGDVMEGFVPTKGASGPSDHNEPRTEAMAFRFKADQYLLVHAALERAAELVAEHTGKKKLPWEQRSDNLELICHDFLAGHTFENGTLENKLAFLVRMEPLLGLRLVILDGSSEKLLYGRKSLKKLSAAVKKAEGIIDDEEE